MKILMINKFLHPNGGSETYIFRLGETLTKHGHEVQYFGMEHEGRCVGNAVNSYTADMDFHGGSILSKLTYPIKTIYSSEARKKIRDVLDDFKPDVCHLNNFNYQLTPSIILEIRKWSRQTGNACRMVYTAHDYQLVCPNHMMNNPCTHNNCEACLGGHYTNCIKGRCIHGSLAKSVIGCIEAYYWKLRKVYKNIDTIICCSEFLKTKMDTSEVLRGRTIALHNFVEAEHENSDKEHSNSCGIIQYNQYVSSEIKQENNRGDMFGSTKIDPYCIYFGRFSEEKGIQTLINVCKKLPQVRFVFAGTGPLEDKLNGIANIENVGFKTGSELVELIKNARFSIYPSEWYENCPFSVMESQIYGTPVIAANIGGIPELVEDGRTGLIFTSGDERKLLDCIVKMWNDEEKVQEMSENCAGVKFDSLEEYYTKIVRIYGGEIMVDRRII